MTPFIIIFLLLAFSAFFSFAETGLTTVSRARIHRLVSEGNKRAIRVSKLIKDRDRTLSAMLLGNNGVNIAASSVATATFIELYGDEGALYATVVITILALVFGEIIPKTYAFSQPEKVALNIVPFADVAVKILSPITGLVQKLVNVLFMILRIETHPENSAIDAIKETINMHHSEGEVVKHDKDMLQSIFSLSDAQVGQVMIHRSKIISININQKPEAIIAQTLDNIHTRIPVWSGHPDNIIGILHAKALLKEVTQAGGDLAKINWNLALSDPWFIPETTKLKDQLLNFRERRVHLALVVDEYGALEGLVTLEDILEEIVGHISDEEEKPTTRAIVPQSDNSYIIDGSAPVRDINRQLHWKLPDSKAATLPGLIIDEARSLPDPGEEFEFFDYRFRILKKHKNKILYIRCWEVPKPKEDQELAVELTSR